MNNTAKLAGCQTKAGKKRQSSKYLHSFAPPPCSIASVIFMAGTDRIMREASALFVHDCWTLAQGDADDLRKIADDLDMQMIACKLAYMRGGIEEAALDDLLKADTWVTPSDAMSYGFATAIDAGEESGQVAASAHKAAYERIFAKAQTPCS